MIRKRLVSDEKIVIWENVMIKLMNSCFFETMRAAHSEESWLAAAAIVTEVKVGLIQGGGNSLSSEICSYADYEYPHDEQWNIKPRNRLQGMHLLGGGAFDCVCYAKLKPAKSDDSSVVSPAAVKMLKVNTTDRVWLT
ncbi:hypothetical protein EB796_007316 [Bugula neritina]|uniref:Uncharacterized protein n=1 Tax=Bugula neritina TaxID=10212 RepID=A0A7J7K6X3_BUGNE|nr:hypothetical protein EB796_007316 [Bugula neritina]